MATTVSYRLPRSVRPVRYVLDLSPDLGAARFAGTVTVSIDVLEATPVLVCNAAEIAVASAVLRRDGATLTPTAVEVDDKLEQVTFRFAEALAPGPAELDIAFTGRLNDDLRGFYRSTFTAADGTDQVIATTQFESTDARRAFPCWDEPDFKATFAVSLVVPEGLTALSCGAEVSVEPVDAGHRRIRFAETMKMSTYVLAWVVGPFELTAPVDVGGVPVRLATPPGRAAMTTFGLDAATHALRYLAGYFALPYPSDKIDHIAIPDFAFGAMENLGCVTYRETALLADVDVASQLELMRVAQVVAHETAHMWFGDLVTMRWWNGIWLNEAFATFMELKTTEAFRPDWEVWTAFGGGKAAALTTDGLRGTRPIEIEVGPPEEAEAMFDVLTYQKGGSVLRMLEQYLGEETFRRGISSYLAKHSYDNTETSDLWDALEAESGEPVRATMDSWIFQGGHPLVSVEPAEDGRAVVLSQRRFVYTGGADAPAGHWAVPVNLRVVIGGQVRRERLLLDGPTTLRFDGPVESIVVNEGGWGFYRVRYAPEFLALLRADLQGLAGPLERAGVIGDTWAAVLAGEAELSEWVHLVEGLGDETDPDVWAAVAGPLNLLDLVATEADRPALAAWTRGIATPAYEHLGWTPQPDESQRAAITRGRVIALLGTVGADPTVRAEAAARVEALRANRQALAADVVTAAVTVVAATGDTSTFDDLLARYRAAATPQDQIRFLTVLGYLPDEALLVRTLDLALSGEVRSQDGPFLMATVLANRAAGEAAWSWVESNWEEIVARFPRNLLLRIFEGIVGMVDPAIVERIHAFFAATELPVAGPRLAQLEERMDVNARFAARVGGGIAAVLPVR